MMRKAIIALGICSLVLVGIGASPRYLEELRIGGGYGDSGTDLEGDGDILTDGDVTLADESALRFGTDADYQWRFNGTALQLRDPAANVLASFTDQGTTGDLALTGALGVTGAITGSHSGNAITIGSSCVMSSPPAIGGVVPAAGAFTTLSGTGTTGNIITGTASSTGTGVYGTSASGYGVNGNSTSGSGIRGTSAMGFAGNIRQTGVMTGDSSNSGLLVIRNVSDGGNAYDATGAVLDVIDNSTNTGTHGALFAGTVSSVLKMTFDPRVPDGASAVAYMIDTSSTLSTAGAKLLSIRNAGVEKAYIGYDGSGYFAGNVAYADSTYVWFGADGEFRLGYDGSYLNLNDKDGNNFSTVEDSGTQGTFNFKNVVQVGSNDVGGGLVDVYGDSSAIGARLRLYNSAAEDTNAEQYMLEAAGDNLNIGYAGAELVLSYTGALTVPGRIVGSTITTFTADDTAPSVASGNVFKVPDTWTADHYIAAFADAAVGQQIVIIGGDSDCAISPGDHMKITAQWTASPGDTLHLVYDGTTWYEISRSNN